jgi:hypothetical protein
MLIAIISDTHDDSVATHKAVEISKARGCEMIIHAGDICSPYTARIIKESGIPAHCVFGNNDGDRIHLAQILDIKPAPRHILADGKSFVIFHEPFINDYIDSERVDFLIYGHTHKLSVDARGAMKIINPGTASGALVNTKTFVLLETLTSKVEIIEL